MKGVVLIGGGTGAQLVFDLCQILSLEVSGYLDDNQENVAEVISSNIEFLGAFSKLDDTVFVSQYSFVIAIHNIKTRSEILKQLRSKNASFINLIHPTAIISPSAKLGQGIIINQYSVVQNGAVLGDAVTIEEQCSVGINVTVGTNVTMAPQTVFTSNSGCGDNCSFGVRSSLVPNAHIGSGCDVLAGSLVVQSRENNLKLLGMPARAIGQSEFGNNSE